METVGSVSNDGEDTMTTQAPYVVQVTLEGTSAMLFHRWSVDGIEAKAKAAKGSAAKKTDDVESYVWRDTEGRICLPGEYVRGSIIEAARYRQDPRSPRKSARDLYKAGVASLTELAPIQVKGDEGYAPSREWDYLDRRRTMVQRQGITRMRPAFYEGWRAEFQLTALLPEYIDHHTLLDVLVQAGRIVGVADFRPTFGRFAVVGYDLQG